MTGQEQLIEDVQKSHAEVVRLEGLLVEARQQRRRAMTRAQNGGVTVTRISASIGLTQPRVSRIIRGL